MLIIKYIAASLFLLALPMSIKSCTAGNGSLSEDNPDAGKVDLNLIAGKIPLNATPYSIDDSKWSIVSAWLSKDEAMTEIFDGSQGSKPFHFTGTVSAESVVNFKAPVGVFDYMIVVIDGVVLRRGTGCGQIDSDVGRFAMVIGSDISKFASTSGVPPLANALLLENVIANIPSSLLDLPFIVSKISDGGKIILANGDPVGIKLYPTLISSPATPANNCIQSVILDDLIASSATFVDPNNPELDKDFPNDLPNLKALMDTNSVFTTSALDNRGSNLHNPSLACTPDNYLTGCLPEFFGISDRSHKLMVEFIDQHGHLDIRLSTKNFLGKDCSADDFPKVEIVKQFLENFQANSSYGQNFNPRGFPVTSPLPPGANFSYLDSDPYWLSHISFFTLGFEKLFLTFTKPITNEKVTIEADLCSMSVDPPMLPPSTTLPSSTTTTTLAGTTTTTTTLPTTTTTTTLPTTTTTTTLPTTTTTTTLPTTTTTTTLPTTTMPPPSSFPPSSTLPTTTMPSPSSFPPSSTLPTTTMGGSPPTT